MAYEAMFATLATLVGGLAPGRARAGRPVGEHIHLGGDEAVGEVLNGDIALVAMMWVVMVLWSVLVSPGAEPGFEYGGQ
jgi:hypothetical protein